MTREGVLFGSGVLFMVAIATAGCQQAGPSVAQTVSLWNARPVLTVPSDVQRIAVLYPRSSNADFLEPIVGSKAQPSN